MQNQNIRISKRTIFWSLICSLVCKKYPIATNKANWQLVDAVQLIGLKCMQNYQKVTLHITKSTLIRSLQKRHVTLVSSVRPVEAHGCSCSLAFVRSLYHASSSYMSYLGMPMVCMLGNKSWSTDGQNRHISRIMHELKISGATSHAKQSLSKQKWTTFNFSLTLY